jgi:hypothetical protein
MQSDRSAAPAGASGSVRGLGVCDALRVELIGPQWPGLTRALDARIAALARAAPEDAAARTEERRLLVRVRERLPEAPRASFALVGPAGLVLAVVHACVVDAVGALARGLEAGAAAPGRGVGGGVPGSWPAALARDAEAAGAWIATALDCRAVEGYCFEPEVDPLHAW